MQFVENAGRQVVTLLVLLGVQADQQNIVPPPLEREKVRSEGIGDGDSAEHSPGLPISRPVIESTASASAVTGARRTTLATRTLASMRVLTRRTVGDTLTSCEAAAIPVGRCGRGRLGVVIACLAILIGSYVATAPIARADVVLINFDDAAAVSGWTTVTTP